MLGLQEELIEQYVATGQVQIVFWPVLNHGAASLYATVTMECAGQQSAELAWRVHRQLFEQQNNLYGFGRADFIELAVAGGAERDPFAACYDSEEALNTVRALDQRRIERGVFSQPYFEVNGTLLAGTGQLVDTLEAAVAAAQP